MFHRGREDDEGLGLSEVLEFIDEVIELFGGLESGLDEHGVIPGHAVALDDVVDGADVGIELLFLGRSDLEIDEGLDAIAELPVVDLGMIAADDAGALEFLNTIGHRRRREKDRCCDVLDGGARICAQKFQDFLVDGVESGFVHKASPS